MKPIILLSIVFLFLILSCKQEPPWQTLFDGETLNGWVQRGGEANYEAKDGMIVGTTVLNTPNSFLCTEKHYENFILELEVNVDTVLNSGIQIRSNSDPNYRNGRVHGYQVEIDPSPRAYSGGIYDEARRGWLQDLSENEAGRQAFKNNHWNHYRIEAIDDTLKTFVNGVPTARVVDGMTVSGFIGLQVHSTSIERPLQVKWRNIRLKDLGKHSRSTGQPGLDDAPDISNLIVILQFKLALNV